MTLAPSATRHGCCHADRAITFPCTELLNLSAGLASCERIYFQLPMSQSACAGFTKGPDRFMRSRLLLLLWATSLPPAAAAIRAKEGLATAKGLPRVQTGIPDPFPGLF